MESITLPQEKIHGERFAQLLVNAIEYHFDIHKPQDVYDKLFSIENTDLELAIDDYLTEVKNQEEEKDAKN